MPGLNLIHVPASILADGSGRFQRLHTVLFKIPITEQPILLTPVQYLFC